MKITFKVTGHHLALPFENTAEIKFLKEEGLKRIEKRKEKSNLNDMQKPM